VALEHGQLERGYKRLATAIELNEKHPAAHYYQGIILQRWQRYDEALAAYQKSYELQTDNPAYLLAISEMLVATDKMDEAIALLESKVTYFDQNAGIRAGLGDLMIAQRQYAKAADYYHQAALLRPDDMGIVEDLAAAQLEAGQTADAIRNLEKLTSDEKRAERRDLQRLLAKAYEDAGRMGDARDVYVKLTRTDPGDVEAWLQLGQIAWSQNDISGALLAANRATALAPKRHEGYLLTGMVWQKRGRTDEAVRNFDRAAELAPTVSEPVILRGIALQQAGKTAAAAEAYAEALRRQPNDARAQSLLASVEVK
jgi:tetratricopeptide (TPR) repeat protein